MNEIFQAIILGIVQGLTEFLPVSSTGHLVAIPQIFHWEGVVSGLAFDLALHIGTTAAVLGFFWRDWWRLATAFFWNLTKGWRSVWKETDSRFFLLLVIGSIPAGLAGALLDSFVEESLRNITLIGAMMIVFGFVLYWADSLAAKRQLEKVTLTDSIFVGLAQVVSLIPGVSRSGITVTAGMFRGLSRESATKFSFLLSTPVIVGAAIYKFKDVIRQGGFGDQSDIFLVGALAATISGWFAIKFLIIFVQKNNFRPFVIYRFVVGVLLILIGLRA